MLNNKNTNILKRILLYCDEIIETIERFGDDYKVFEEDSAYRNATALCVLQIGELTNNLTDDFKQTYDEMQWTQIKALRNIIAHSYGKIDVESLWETITGDIPGLKTYCTKIVQELSHESVTVVVDKNIKDTSTD